MISTAVLVCGQATAQDSSIQTDASTYGANISQEIPVRLSENTLFELMMSSGFAAGERGADQSNRFSPYFLQFLDLTHPSQDFILGAFSEGMLRVVPEGGSLEVENGKMAVNLINLVVDLEVLALFVQTQEIPEGGQLPRADDNLERLLRKYPNVVSVVTPEFQTRVAEVEADADRIVSELLARATAEADRSEAEADRAEVETARLRLLVGKMEALLDAADIN